MFCSTIIPTIGRPTLGRAVRSVLEQQVDSPFEVIVVNDSGQPLPSEPWQQQPNVRLLQTNQRERCVARNVGAAVANGRYLHFLDDDDWLLPGALQALWRLSHQEPDAGWLCGTTRFQDKQGAFVGTIDLARTGNCFAQTVAGFWVPLQASLIRSDVFFSVGGFHPTMYVTQDLDLARRVALVAPFASISTVLACVLRGQNWGSSTEYERGADWVRWGRDRILAEDGAFRRLQDSADDGFWQGRIFHAYLTAALFNVRQKRYSTAFSRGLFAAAALLKAGKHLFSADYWRALRTHHVGRDFH
jgi:glycosyltransferase involved in cell wall biosynthesis